MVFMKPVYRPNQCAHMHTVSAIELCWSPQERWKVCESFSELYSGSKLVTQLAESMKYWLNWPFYFHYSTLRELKYSYSPQLIGLTSIYPVWGKYKMKGFCQHEIVAPLIYRQHKFCILNFTSQEAPKCEFVTKQMREETPHTQRMIE